jgi:hypothetical protein
MEICMTRLATKEIKKMNKIRGQNKKIQSTSHVKKKKEGKKEENKKKKKEKIE